MKIIAFEMLRLFTLKIVTNDVKKRRGGQKIKNCFLKIFRNHFVKITAKKTLGGSLHWKSFLKPNLPNQPSVHSPNTSAPSPVLQGPRFHR
jgi:hypothetical protein